MSNTASTQGMRKAVVVTHEALSNDATVAEAISRLESLGFEVSMRNDIPDTQNFGEHATAVDGDVEIVVVLGGDGTILRAAELVKGTDVPIIGINTGHVGFLAEFESFELGAAMQKIADRDYTIDERMIAAVELFLPGHTESICDWSLNDVILEHEDRARMVEVGITVDDIATSSFGCDGVLVSTPTGSTAYAFSAGGPVMWPDVKALELTPIAAHALFTRPLIIGSSSTFELHVLEASSCDGWICCDGRRQRIVPKGSRVRIRQSSSVLRLARLSDALFTDRLVRKFDLPVKGWRETAAEKKGYVK
ncbi:NAD kinase [Alloscardovia theropitheci]|uniref:NAD kinase n=1 Tax=Alloscardovia theropitheci TaxID=2496842 RepID=A0A4V2MTR7_9BIFI|nr:NAD kinase [Alloscardovia theropitheci]TCD53569.1 NAD kinase [Alloscardovia theropitheci]